MALALPITRIVVLEQRDIRMEWEIAARISTTPSGLSKLSIIHLLPSRSLRGGFLVRKLSGLGFLLGCGDLDRDERLLWESERVETGALARRDGFLWVCDEGETFRRCEVTASPFDS